MLQQLVDNVLAVAKESVKTITYESLNIVARLINGFSALLLAILPGKSSILEGMHGWELRPTFRGPRLPCWMENGVSSFNKFIHELSDYSDFSSVDDYTSGEEDNEEHMLAGTPRSQASRLSHASSFHRYERRLVRLTKYLFSWVLWPLTFFLSLPLLFYQSVWLRSPGASQDNHLVDQQTADIRLEKSNNIKHHIVHSTIDRRRGVIEDLHFAIEIFIEAIFDMVHKAAHFLLSPSDACRMISSWFSPAQESCGGVFSTRETDTPIPTATMGENDPTPNERGANFCQSLNTDGRTCEDVIREHGYYHGSLYEGKYYMRVLPSQDKSNGDGGGDIGMMIGCWRKILSILIFKKLYPYEAIRVITADGYVLLLERIPRCDSRKVVYLQHGILDSSLGWVSNGVVGSPAFAAFDQGYDVFLGNLRGLVSREHVDRNISSYRYWKYSINEHGTKDAPAIIEKIHEVKTSELENTYKQDENSANTDQPYRICAVCHSLGGAAMLMHVITRRIEEKPHRLSRLILLSPAGFHEDSNIAFTLAEYFMLVFGPVIAPFIPGLYIPTRFFRMLLNKLARDFHSYPALGGLVQTLMSYFVGGDTSNWVGVLGLTHYNMYDMPGVSVRVAMHLAQMKHTRKFIMYDYGSAAANMEAYGSPWPLDLGQHYNLIDIPVALVAGKKDQVIRPSMVRKHYRLMRKADVEVSFNEFEYAHLDFTFSHREELLAYVMSHVLLVVSPQKKQGCQKKIREKKARRNQSRNGGSHLLHSSTDETDAC